MTPLARFVADALARPVPGAVAEAAAWLGAGDRRVVAVLFYGSVLRSGVLSDVLDFYVLTDGPRGRALHLWPDVGSREIAIGGGGGDRVRATVATMPLAAFAAAARVGIRDATIWTRFCQPAALAWARDETARRAAMAAVTDAIVSAGRFAALHGPRSGPPLAYWRALFAATYDIELRFEAPGRGDGIVAAAADYFAAALALAWTDAGIAFRSDGDIVTPRLDPGGRGDLARRWRQLRRAGKPLNAARLVKAAFTFEGASAYALYKVARHTGVTVPLTPWRARHPLLAAPGVLWRIWRARPAR